MYKRNCHVNTKSYLSVIWDKHYSLPRAAYLGQYVTKSLKFSRVVCCKTTRVEILRKGAIETLIKWCVLSSENSNSQSFRAELYNLRRIFIYGNGWWAKVISVRFLGSFIVVLLREIEINVAANFLIVSILVFVRKNSPEKKKRYNNIKSERKHREKHLFCVLTYRKSKLAPQSLTFKIP